MLWNGEQTRGRKARSTDSETAVPVVTGCSVKIHDEGRMVCLDGALFSLGSFFAAATVIAVAVQLDLIRVFRGIVRVR